jgi:hypothetical protein
MLNAVFSLEEQVHFLSPEDPGSEQEAVENDLGQRKKNKP